MLLCWYSSANIIWAALSVGYCKLLVYCPSKLSYPKAQAILSSMEQSKSQMKSHAWVQKIIWSKCNTGAVLKWRNLLGPTDSELARVSAPESLRAAFGTDKTKNACHGSDGAETAQQECEFFFRGEVKTRSTANNLLHCLSKHEHSHYHDMRNAWNPSEGAPSKGTCSACVLDLNCV